MLGRGCRHALVLLALAVVACSRDQASSPGGSASAATSLGATTSTLTNSTSSATAVASGSSAVSPCNLPVRSQGIGCPAPDVAAAAWQKMLAACHLGNGPPDFSLAGDAPPMLMPEGRAKVCASCPCQVAIDEYAAYYGRDCADPKTTLAMALARELRRAVAQCGP